MARKIIVVDSKGLDASLTKDLADMGGKSEREAAQISTEIRTMQLFIKVADMVLFLLPHSEIHNASAQLALFELSTVRCPHSFR